MRPVGSSGRAIVGRSRPDRRPARLGLNADGRRRIIGLFARRAAGDDQITKPRGDEGFHEGQDASSQELQVEEEGR